MFLIIPSNCKNIDNLNKHCSKYILCANNYNETASQIVCAILRCCHGISLNLRLTLLTDIYLKITAPVPASLQLVNLARPVVSRIVYSQKGVSSRPVAPTVATSIKLSPYRSGVPIVIRDYICCYTQFLASK